MEKASGRLSCIFGYLVSFLRKCIFKLVTTGPMPNHIAFILDGNRRFEKKWNLATGAGYRFGFLAVMYILEYCFELGIKYVTIYAFSIDNFKRNPETVETIMNLLQEKIEALVKDMNMVNRYELQIRFVGNLQLLSEPVRSAVEKIMSITRGNSKAVLLVCIAYSSSNEIMNSVHETFKEKRDEVGENCKDEKEQIVRLTDIEKNMYMAVAPDPDILIRTSGETRLSNFLLWQTSYTYLYSPAALWPEIGLRHLLWAILNFQRNRFYLDKRRKKL